jgi:hypothetical protein
MKRQAGVGTLLAMRRVIFLAGLALVVGVLAPGGALPAVGGSDLPLKGSFSGTTSHTLATGHLDAVSTGKSTHFGLTTLKQSVQVVATGPTTRSWSGTWTLTAANGDQMVGTCVGMGTLTDPTHITFVIDYLSGGGTGRFADASATFTITLYFHRVALVSGISYGEHTATLQGQLSW